MPGPYTYPGIYIEEIPSGVRTITGVSTSDTAFVDFFRRGSTNIATRITSFADFERTFGGLDSRSEAAYAIRQFYLNGGSVAWVVRVETDNAATAALMLQGGEPAADTLALAAQSYGQWGNNLRVAIDHRSGDPATLFNLVVRLVEPVNGREQIIATEIHRNLSMDSQSSRFAGDVLRQSSQLIRLADDQPNAGELPAATGDDVIGQPGPDAFLDFAGGDDGDAPPRFAGDPDGAAWLAGGAQSLLGSEADNTGMYALSTIAPFIFNLLCIPAAAALADEDMAAVYTDAAAFCRDHRAFLIVDLPEAQNNLNVRNWAALDGLRDDHAALYFPRLNVPDPLNENRPRSVGPSGTLAGVYARIDATRGIWKAPAGTEADLRGAGVSVSITDLNNGALNQSGINTLRTFPIFGSVSWSARTLDGADQQASEWKYIPIRRLALYIEESLFQGLKWVVFEPNDEPLWAQIRLNVGAFLNTLFRQGAFQGTTPREAYFVKCDRETTTQNDINNGIVNVVVGFAPLRPAEFVVIQIQQLAGQLQV